MRAFRICGDVRGLTVIVIRSGHSNLNKAVWLTDYFMSICLGLSYARRLGNHVHSTFIFFFFLFPKRFFYIFRSNMNNFVTDLSRLLCPPKTIPQHICFHHFFQKWIWVLGTGRSKMKQDLVRKRSNSKTRLAASATATWALWTSTLSWSTSTSVISFSTWLFPSAVLILLHSIVIVLSFSR